MKKIVFLAASVLLIGCGDKQPDKVTAKNVLNPVTAEGVNSSVKMPKIEVVGKDGKDGSTFDFGVIIQGENVVHTFEIKNVGDADLVISSANASCGCTVPKFSREPIPPGKTGKVEVAFSSAGRVGKQLKTVTLLTNAQPSTVTLTIVANIIIPN
ncbi:MAG TPA: DUF1573 domain-containing protein [Salinivirgaceae bacterium]|nr:DUF1573 domain-containing protein [Salinivirgaceae bacterium]